MKKELKNVLLLLTFITSFTMNGKEFEDFLRQTIEEELISRSRYFFVGKDLYKISVVNIERKRQKQRKEDKATRHLMMQLGKPYWELGKGKPN